jgi:hypothetical protein
VTPGDFSVNITAQDLPYGDAGTPLTGVLCMDAGCPPLMVARARAGLAALARCPAVDGRDGRVGADWQLVMYGGALHGFTHSGEAPGAVPGVAHDPRADSRSFVAARGFLAEAFAGADAGSFSAPGIDPGMLWRACLEESGGIGRGAHRPVEGERGG